MNQSFSKNKIPIESLGLDSDKSKQDRLDDISILMKKNGLRGKISRGSYSVDGGKLTDGTSVSIAWDGNATFLGKNSDAYWNKFSLELGEGRDLGQIQILITAMKNQPSIKEAVNSDNENAVLDLDAVKEMLDSLFEDFDMQGEISDGTLRYGLLDSGDYLEITEEGEVDYSGLMELVTNVFSDDSEIESFGDMEDLSVFLSDYAAAFIEVMEALEDGASGMSEDSDMDENYRPQNGDKVIFELEGEVYGGTIINCANLSEDVSSPNWNIFFIDEEGDNQSVVQALDGAENFQFTSSNALLENAYVACRFYPELSPAQVSERIFNLKGINGVRHINTGIIHHSAAEKLGYRKSARRRLHRKLSSAVRHRISIGNKKSWRRGFHSDSNVGFVRDKFGIKNNTGRNMTGHKLRDSVQQTPKNPFLGEEESKKKDRVK